jgi:hypothetical protein
MLAKLLLKLFLADDPLKAKLTWFRAASTVCTALVSTSGKFRDASLYRVLQHLLSLGRLWELTRRRQFSR